jgi:DNA-binding transcriptional LysR family regulator
METLADAATKGMGLASLPCWLIRDRVKAGALVRVLPDLPQQSYEIYALWPRAPFMPIRLRAAIDVLVAEMPAASHLGGPLILASKSNDGQGSNSSSLLKTTTA